MAHKAVEPARHSRGKKLVVAVARIIPVQHDRPRLGITVLVAKRREWDPHFESPAVFVDARRGFPEEIRRRVFARRIVNDRIGLDVSRRHDEQSGGVTAVARVDEDSAKIVEPHAGVVPI